MLRSLSLCVCVCRLFFGVKPDCFDHVLVENMLFLFSLRLWHHGHCFSFLFCCCCCCCWQGYCQRQGSGVPCHLLLLPTIYIYIYSVFFHRSASQQVASSPFLSDVGNSWKSCSARQQKCLDEFSTFRILFQFLVQSSDEVSWKSGDLSWNFSIWSPIWIKLASTNHWFSLML